MVSADPGAGNSDCKGWGQGVGWAWGCYGVCVGCGHGLNAGEPVWLGELDAEAGAWSVARWCPWSPALTQLSLQGSDQRRPLMRLLVKGPGCWATTGRVGTSRAALVGCGQHSNDHGGARMSLDPILTQPVDLLMDWIWGGKSEECCCGSSVAGGVRRQCSVC